MFFEQFYLSCLAHASYMVASKGEAVVIDPQRDVEIYLETAKENGLRIVGIFETHLHADFVSGHVELAARTGAKVYLARTAGAQFEHVPVDDNFEMSFGDCKLRVRTTPGHTPEGICVEVYDPEQPVAPWGVFTGDTLFIGDVGRPDLSPTHTPEQLAGMLYDSLHEKLLTLPDETLVFPAHGAGSLCGRAMRDAKSSTIATERLTNYACLIKTREEFVQALTTNLPVRPQYFAQDAQLNREGAAPLNDLPALPALSPAEVQRLQKDGVTVLDVRTADEFAAGHVPGAVQIGLGGQFASWAGTLFGVRSVLIVVGANGEHDDHVKEARIRLARVGIEEAVGYLGGGVTAWQAEGYPLAQVAQMTAAELAERQKQGVTVLDVRREGEYKNGHIEGAQWHALDAFPTSLPDLPKDAPVAVHCKSGYRSMVAASLLQKAGFTNVTNVQGGFDAWVAAGLPVVGETVCKG